MFCEDQPVDTTSVQLLISMLASLNIGAGTRTPLSGSAKISN
jgi:hypothetical protein